MTPISITMRAAILLAGVALAGQALLAHHSGQVFDDAKVVELKGTVKELQWTNPHIWLQVVVDQDGSKKEWSLEGGSPNSLSRNGWRATTFKPGDVITFRASPMRDGSPAGSFIAAKFADGKTIGRWQDGK
jgi:hypothetical protein